MPVKSVPSMGWTRRSAAISVLLVCEEQRKQAGQRVIALREARNWSQEDLAQHAQVSVKTVSRFENGRNEGRQTTVRKLAKAFKVAETEITGPPPAPLGLGETPLERLERKLDALLAVFSVEDGENLDASIQAAREGLRLAVRPGPRVGARTKR